MINYIKIFYKIRLIKMSNYYQDGRTGFVGNGYINQLTNRRITNTEIDGDPYRNGNIYMPFHKIVNVEEVMQNVHADNEYVKNLDATKPIINYLNGEGYGNKNLNNLRKTNIDFMPDPDYIYGLAAEGTRKPQPAVDIITRPFSTGVSFVNPQVNEQHRSLSGRTTENVQQTFVALYDRNAGGYKLVDKKHDNRFSHEIAPMFFEMRVNNELVNIPVTFDKINVEAHVREHAPLILNVTSDIKIVLKDVKSQFITTEGKHGGLLTVNTPHVLRERSGRIVNPKTIKSQPYLTKAIDDLNKGALTDYNHINLNVQNKYMYNKNINQDQINNFIREVKYTYPEIQKAITTFLQNIIPDIPSSALKSVQTQEYMIENFYRYLQNIMPNISSSSFKSVQNQQYMVENTYGYQAKVNNDNFENVIRAVKDPKYIIQKLSNYMQHVNVENVKNNLKRVNDPNYLVFKKSNLHAKIDTPINQQRIREVQNHEIFARGTTKIEKPTAPSYKNYQKQIYHKPMQVQYSQHMGTIIPQV
jgi:hypothetical protein